MERGLLPMRPEPCHHDSPVLRGTRDLRPASFQREIVDARLREPRRCRKLPEAEQEMLAERARGLLSGEVGRVSDHKVRRDATEHALDIRRDRAVAAEETMFPEQPQIARLRHRAGVVQPHSLMLAAIAAI